MIDTVLNLLFRCSHRRLTRPVSPLSKGGVHGSAYVVCLDCGKQFPYDTVQMRIGKPLESSLDSGVLNPDMPKVAAPKLKLVIWASIPLMFLMGSFLKARKPPEDRKKPGGDG
jgi:hypothetical protein